MRRGMTIVEMMGVIIVLSLVLTSVYKIFSGAQRGAREITMNHTINDDLQFIVNRLTDDIREASFVDEHMPPVVTQAQAEALETEDATNEILFNKVHYDFTKDPNTLATDQVNYTQTRVRYFLKKANPTVATSAYTLFREALPIDDRRQPIPAKKTIFPIRGNIDRLVFYRLQEPNQPGAGNVFLRIMMTRRDKAGSTEQKYTSDIVTSIKERGAQPE